MKIEDKLRVASLKTSAIVLNELANTFKDVQAKQETKSLVWSISWAVAELEKYKKGEID